jgi:hypothetical protein
MPGGGEPRSRHEKRPAAAAAAPRGEPHRRSLAAARCPQSGGGSAEPPLSTAAAPSARIDPPTADAARGPGVLPVARGQVVRPRSRSRVGLRRRDARRRRYLGWVRVVWAAPAGPAPPAPRGRPGPGVGPFAPGARFHGRVRGVGGSLGSVQGCVTFRRICGRFVANPRTHPTAARPRSRPRRESCRLASPRRTGP